MLQLDLTPVLESEWNWKCDDAVIFPGVMGHIAVRVGMPHEKGYIHDESRYIDRKEYEVTRHDAATKVSIARQHAARGIHQLVKALVSQKKSSYPF